VLLRRPAVGSKLQIETFGRIAISADAPEAIYDISQSVHELFLRERQFKKAKIVIGLGTDRVILKKESFPPLSNKELRQTLNFGIQKDLGREGEEVAIVNDFQNLGPDPAVEGNTEYLCFGAEEPAVAEKAGVIASQGVIPVKILPNILALKNLLDLIPQSISSETVCFLDIGAARSVLTFFRKGRVDFYREIIIGGDDFTKAITGTIFHEGRAIQFTTKEALEFKLKHGYPLGFAEGLMFRGAPLTEVGAMMRPVVERLTGEIHRSVGFYKEKSGGGSIKALYLLGGGSELKHLSQVLTERLDIATSLLPHAKEIRISGGAQKEQVFRSKYLEYGTALSLALETKADGNLLPHKFQKLHRMASILRKLNLAAAVILLTVGIITAFESLILKNLQSQKVIDARHAVEVTRKVVRYEQNLKTRTEVQAGMARFEEKIKQNPANLRILRMVSNVLPKNLSLVSLKIGTAKDIALQAGEKPAVSSAQTKAPGSTAAVTPEKEPVLLRIEGESKPSIPDIRVSVAQFMLDLSKSGYITDVKLQDEKIIEKTDEFIFNIEGTLK
jgi:type IV pilus assembly protein PilM